MKFMVTWSYPADRWTAVMKRWNKREPTPMEHRGCKFLGRWHGIATNKGFMLWEVDDATALAEVLNGWSDLLDYEVTLVNADEDIPEGYTVDL